MAHPGGDRVLVGEGGGDGHRLTFEKKQSLFALIVIGEWRVGGVASPTILIAVRSRGRWIVFAAPVIKPYAQ